MNTDESIRDALRRIDEEDARREREASGELTAEDVDVIADKIRRRA